jgi:hypothetical protein
MDTKAGGPLPEGAKSAAAPYRSDTGELTFDPARRLLRIDAPQAAGIFGFIGDAPASVGPVTVESHGFIAFLLTALDNRPLDKSAHMLLSLPGYTVRPGQKLINYPGTTDWWTLSSDNDRPSGAYSGTGPVLMERADCVLQLRGVTVYLLDGSGNRLPALEGSGRIHLSAATPWYEVTR